MMSITMKDIAKIAGVSTNTVSRALNNKPEIDKETKRRIIEIANKLNYTPNSIAASLASNKTRTIGLVIPDISDPFFAQQTRGVEDTVRAKGFSVIIINTDENPEAELKAVNTFRGIRVAGIILTSVFPDTQHLKLLQDQKIPFVLLNRWSPAIETDYVINDNVAGAYAATKHLIKKGHTRIAFITGIPKITSVQERLKGYRQAFQEANLPILEELIVHSESLDPQAGKVYARQLLSLQPRPTAILAYCDQLALGVYTAVKESKLSIPEDIALVGYDDIPFSAFFEVPLTTVAQPAYQMGSTASDILIERINAAREEKEEIEVANAPKKQIVFKPQLVVRRSCGAGLKES